jgi:hypothetical protein
LWDIPKGILPFDLPGNTTFPYFQKDQSCLLKIPLTLCPR